MNHIGNTSETHSVTWFDFSGGIDDKSLEKVASIVPLLMEGILIICEGNPAEVHTYNITNTPKDEERI